MPHVGIRVMIWKIRRMKNAVPPNIFSGLRRGELGMLIEPGLEWSVVFRNVLQARVGDV